MDERRRAENSAVSVLEVECTAFIFGDTVRRRSSFIAGLFEGPPLAGTQLVLSSRPLPTSFLLPYYCSLARRAQPVSQSASGHDSDDAFYGSPRTVLSIRIRTLRTLRTQGGRDGHNGHNGHDGGPESELDSIHLAYPFRPLLCT